MAQCRIKYLFSMIYRNNNSLRVLQYNIKIPSTRKLQIYPDTKLRTY